MLAIANGERQGELLGLKWSDVDWEASQISIQRTLHRLFGHALYVVVRERGLNVDTI